MSTFAPIRIVSPSQFNIGTAQTPGSERRAALARDQGVATGLWGGLFIVQPGAQTAIHHHGVQETIAYVLKGECYVRWGENAANSARSPVRATSFMCQPGCPTWKSINRRTPPSSGSWCAVRLILLS